MNDTQVVNSGGIGLTGLLGVLFVGLKLGGVISWSWWYVTMPFWIGFPIALIVLLGILLGYGFYKMCNFK